MSKRPPTERQLQIATIMLRHFDEHGQWPTQREVADEMGLNTTNMSPYFTALVKKGVAEKIPDRQRRNIKISKEGEELIRSGPYRTGADPEVDAPIRFFGPAEAFLNQRKHEAMGSDETFARIYQLLGEAGVKVEVPEG